VTYKGQGRDPNIFGANYLENGWRYSVTIYLFIYFLL